MQAIRRPLSSIFKAQKAVTYGLSASRHADLQVPVHRQFTTFASGSLRYASPAQNLRRVHVRTISYSSIPTSIVRVFRVPITVVLVGTGVYWYASYKFEELKRYASYKFEELKRWALARLNNVMLDLALKAVGSRVSEVKLPEIPETWVNDVQVIATNILKSTTNGLNDVGSRIQEVKLPDISETGAGKFIKNLFGGQQHKEGAGENEGNEGEKQSNKKPPSDEAVVAAHEGEKPPAWLNAVQGTANDILKSATNGLNDVGSRVSEVKLPDIPETWVNDVQVTASNILKSTTNGLNDVGSRIQEVKLPDISETGAGKLIKNLFGGQQHKEGAGENEGSEGERQSDKKRPTDAESEIVDEKDRPPSAQ